MNIFTQDDNNIDKKVTWEAFSKQLSTKELIIHGTGMHSRLLWYRVEEFAVSAVVDKDNSLVGMHWGDIVAAAYDSEYADTIIQSEQVMDCMDSEKYVILVTSVNYYKDIKRRLKKKGFTNIWSIYEMEANHLLVNPDDELKNEFFYDRWNNIYRNNDVVPKKVLINMTAYVGHNIAIIDAIKMLVGADISEWQFVWIVKNVRKWERKKTCDRYIFYKNTKAIIKEASSSKIFMWDNPLPLCIRKSEDQIYIQTKHWASITLKKFALQDETLAKNKESVDLYYRDAKQMDYLLVGSDFDEESCRRGFAYEGKCLKVGSARSDVLFGITAETKRDIKIGICNNEQTNILLYAPTFRYVDSECNQSMDLALMPNFKLLHDRLVDRFGGEWNILIRLHPSISCQSKKINYEDYMKDVSSYPNSEELVAIADVLITDYSSIMFEAAFIGHPVFLYAPDREQYIDGERGLLLDYDNLPFQVSLDNDELLAAIDRYDVDNYRCKLKKFMDFHGVYEDGHASLRTALFINDITNGEIKELSYYESYLRG